MSLIGEFRIWVMRNVRRCWHFCVFEIFCEVLLSWWKIFELFPAASLRYFDGGSSLLRKCAGFNSTIPLTIVFHSKKCYDPFISYRENLLHTSVKCQTDDFILGSLSSGPIVICFFIHADRCPVLCLSVTSFPFLWVRPVILTVAENPEGINFACSSRPFVHGARRGGKHAMDHFRWKFQSNFENVLNGIQTEGSQRPDVEALKNVRVVLHVRVHGDSPVIVAMTHIRRKRTRARDTHEVWSNTLVECEFDPSTCARTRTAKTTSQNEAHHRIALELDRHPHKVTTYQRMSDEEATDARRFLLDITLKRHKTQRSCRLSLFQSFTVLGRPTIRSLSRRFSFSCWCRMNGPRFLAVHTKAMIAEKLTGIKLKDFTRWKIRRDVLLFTRMHWSHHFSTDQISTLALHLLFDFPVSLFN